MDYASLRRLRFVPRWGVVPHLKPQNVAEHSFHVLWIYNWLYERYQFSPPTFSDAMRVLGHDDEEAGTGDHPSPTKGFADTSKEMAPKCWLKVADCLEMCLFLNEEQYLGNKCLDSIVTDNAYRGNLWVTRLKQFGVSLPTFEELGEILWEEVHIENHIGLRGVKYAR